MVKQYENSGYGVAARNSDGRVVSTGIDAPTLKRS